MRTSHNKTSTPCGSPLDSDEPACIISNPWYLTKIYSQITASDQIINQDSNQITIQGDPSAQKFLWITTT